MIDASDPLALAQALIQCPSVTPSDAGAQAIVASTLSSLGFQVQELTFEAEGTPNVPNLFARLGDGGPHLAFNGHTDVVPPGASADWSSDPFSASIVDGELLGRGAVDMKTGVAAFVAACARFLARVPTPPGSISLLITGDEEGPAINGTTKLIEWAASQGHQPDACLVGEPTSVETVGDTIKIGRRGSLTCYIEVKGIQGHVAYPDRADNAAHRLVSLLNRLTTSDLDGGNEHFPPSSLQVTTIDIGNPAINVVPGRAHAALNIRYNTEHSGDSLRAWISREAETCGDSIALQFHESAKPFMTAPGMLSKTIAQAIGEVQGISPTLSTTGGTSDARFIRSYCPVIECGLVGKLLHATNERVPVADIECLTRIYERFIDCYFQAASSR